jgi:DNA-binding CsgD family transcriptional regulator
MKNGDLGGTMQSQEQSFRVQPKRFVFYDKSSGTERFEVKADADGKLPADQAASLMAIHCFVRGRAPKDFAVMVAPEEDLLESLVPMARRLVQACGESRAPIHLSSRQRDVLRAVMQDGSNKEIAAKLHISVRTVKFHVAALFEKFNVRSRLGLARKASDILLPEAQRDEPTPMHDRRDLHLMRAPAAHSSIVRTQPVRMIGNAQRASR